jgi:hypothetical protein
MVEMSNASSADGNRKEKVTTGGRTVVVRRPGEKGFAAAVSNRKTAISQALSNYTTAIPDSEVLLIIRRPGTLAACPRRFAHHCFSTKGGIHRYPPLVKWDRRQTI